MNFQKFLTDEKGSAITEFVIGLPVFLMIFSGILALYQLHEVNLKTVGTANYNLWKASDKKPEWYNWLPAGGAADEVINGNGKIWDKLLSINSGVRGTYGESQVLTIIPQTLIPGTDLDVKGDIKDITGLGDDSPSNNLLNDAIDLGGLSIGGSGGIVPRLLKMALDVSGSRLAVGAGIRYGETRGEYLPGSVTVVTGLTYNPKPLKLSIPLNTATTHRIFPVALTRLEHMTEEPLSDATLTFESDFDNPENPDWIKDSEEPAEADSDKNKACLEKMKKQGEKYMKCKDDGMNSAPHPPTQQDIKKVDDACKQYQPKNCIKK